MTRQEYLKGIYIAFALLAAAIFSQVLLHSTLGGDGFYEASRDKPEGFQLESPGVIYSLFKALVIPALIAGILFMIAFFVQISRVLSKRFSTIGLPSWAAWTGGLCLLLAYAMFAINAGFMDSYQEQYRAVGINRALLPAKEFGWWTTALMIFGLIWIGFSLAVGLILPDSASE